MHGPNYVALPLQRADGIMLQKHNFQGVWKNLTLREEERGYEYFSGKVQRFICEKSCGKLFLPNNGCQGANVLSVLNVAGLL